MTAIDQIDLFRAAQRFRRQPALVADDQVLSYEALAQLALPLAFQLDALRREPGFTRLCIQAGNSRNTVLTLLTLLSLRIPFVPLHPRLTAAEAAQLRTLSGSSHFLCDADIGAMAGTHPGKDLFVARTPGTATCAVIMFTSGVSGTPKGAVLRHDALIASAAASASNLGWQPSDRWVLCLPLCHVGGLSILTRALLAGRCVILSPSSDAKDIIDVSWRHGGTLLSLVPTQLQRILIADSDNRLGALRAILVGGAAAPEAVMRECAVRKVMALQTWGLTEACSQVSAERPGESFSAPRGCGRPLPGIGLRVTDEHGAEVPVGQGGCLRIRGPVLMEGYLGHPPLEPEAEFDTGDIGYLDPAGIVHVQGRADDTIITGGENVYPLEIENVISRMPGVEAVVVFGVPDAEWGQVVAAALRLNPAVELNEGALSAFIKDHLAPHKRPRCIAVVPALPQRSNGKIDRRRAAHESTPLLIRIRS